MALARRCIRMTFPAFASFIAGWTAGGLLEVHFGLWALAFPVVLAVFPDLRRVQLSKYSVRTVLAKKAHFACAVSAADAKASIDTFV
jgi:hypothetical protein